MDVDRLDLVFPLFKQGDDVVVDGDLVILDNQSNDEFENTESDRLLLVLSLPHQAVFLDGKDLCCEFVEICLIIERLDLEEHD